MPETAAIDSERLLTLFREMVDIYSPSGKEEELTEYLATAIAARGLHVTRQPVDEQRQNLLVSTGRGRPDTLFLGHIDTVPALDIERYEFSEHDGLCSGLGTADMKSGCAAMIEAFISAAEAGTLPDGALLALVVGEEENGDGTQALLASHRYRQALVAEPTDLRPCLEHYGYVEMFVRAFGYRCHAALSERDTHAIRTLLRFLLRLEEHVDQEAIDAVMNIRDLHSSESGFAAPDRCAASIDLHIPPGITACEYAEALRAFATAELSLSKVSRFEIEFPTLANGYRTNPLDSLPRHLEAIYTEQGWPWAPMAFMSHSDANLLKDADCSPVILGPGQLTKAHTRDESVSAQQVVAAAGIYAQLLAALPA